jgi:hypothetical protein
MILILYAREEKAIGLKRVWQTKIIPGDAFLKVFLMLSRSICRRLKAYRIYNAGAELNSHYIVENCLDSHFVFL